MSTDPRTTPGPAVGPGVPPQQAAGYPASTYPVTTGNPPWTGDPAAGDDPERLRRQIEHTQRTLSSDVDRLTEKVTPGRVVQRRVDRARRRLSGLRERVMGSASSASGGPGVSGRVSGAVSTAGDRISETTSTVADRASSAASGAADAVSEAPQAIRRGTEGNPLAAGLIAFGAGWLVSSLIPASRPEQQLGQRAVEVAKEHSGQLGEVAGQVRDTVQENLREPARQAAESVRSTAQDAASTVTDETRSAAGDVAGRAQEAKQNVQQHQRS